MEEALHLLLHLWSKEMVESNNSPEANVEMIFLLKGSCLKNWVSIRLNLTSGRSLFTSWPEQKSFSLLS